MLARRSIPIVFTLIVLAITPPLYAGCSGNQRQKTIKASVVTVNAARDGFKEWDRLHQLKIVEQAASREEAEFKLRTYRVARTFVVDLFEVVYRALAVAATETDEASLQEALRQAKKLLEAIEALKGDLRWATG